MLPAGLIKKKKKQVSAQYYEYEWPLRSVEYTDVFLAAN